MEFGSSPPGEEPIEVAIADARAYWTFATRGTLGAAEAYLAGWWTCDDLVGLFRLLTRNADVMSSLDRGLPGWLTRAAAWAYRWRRNTRSVSRRNIRAHYDLSDEFFSLFLDETMAYSSGIYPTAGATLLEASLEKFDRICRTLQLKPHHHVLEIGGGWGGLAIYAAREYGCRVTTTTISRNQYEFTQQAVKAAGLGDRIEVRCEDYRDLTGEFDRIVSIEMIEAVGHEFLETFFRVCSQRLRDDGAMLLQSITLPDERYDAYRQSVDFIQQYIFPGGNIPSPGAIASALQAGDLSIRWREDFGLHYAQTMKHWREQFAQKIDRVRRLGFDDRFLRMWHYYLCYCEAGFLDSQISVAHFLLAKPNCRIETTSC